jgi:hypothetical protein
MLQGVVWRVNSVRGGEAFLIKIRQMRKTFRVFTLVTTTASVRSPNNGLLSYERDTF